MPYIQLDEQQIALAVGEAVIGSSAKAHVQLTGQGVEGSAAFVRVTPDQHATIRRATPSSQIRVNGVVLGAEPTPLIHGDKIEIGGRALFYGDDRKAGSTQHIAGLNLPELLRKEGKQPAKPTVNTGGRLVSLVDGREYSVPPTGLVIGRDATCDVVVASSDVSRKHALVESTRTGYLVRDTSTNGVFVNGERVATTQTLGRGDIVRIGTEDFRFYADSAPGDVAAPAVPSASTPRPAEASPPSASPASSSAQREKPRPTAPAPAEQTPVVPHPAFSSTASASSRTILAVLEVMNEGMLKGRRFEIRTPLAHVGRGSHNDVVIGDESVSESHAKIQKRDAGWFVVDMGSTNGTYVGGRRIGTEQQLVGAPDVRFGGVKLVFRPATDERSADDLKGTRPIAAMRIPPPAPSKPPAMPKGAGPVVAPGATTSDDTPRQTKIPAPFWIVALLLVAAAAAFVLLSR